MRNRLSKRCSMLLLLAVAACGKPAPPPAAPPPPPPEPPPAPVITPAELDTLAEILRLEDRREFNGPRFEVWAASSSALVRKHTALGAGRIRNSSAASLLLRMVADPDSAVRADVAFALGELGDSTAAVMQALAHIARTGSGADAVEAVAGLGRLAATGSYTGIEAVLADPGRPSAVRREALLAIARLTRTTSMLDLLRPYVADSSFETRWRAVYALTRASSDPRAVPLLLQSLNDPEPLVRALAARGLRAATADSAAQRTEVAPALARTLADPHPHVRINALRALGSFRDAAYAGQIAALLRDADGNVNIAAAEALADIPAAAVDLQAVAQDGNRSIGLRYTALTSLLRAHPQMAVEQARAWLNAPAWLQRLYAVRALAAARTPAAQPDLRRASADADVRVAASALQAVAADTTSSPYALFIERLAHRDPNVRAAALRALQRRAHPSDLELFLQAYAQSLRDTARVALNAAVDALGELQKRGVPVDRSFFLRFRAPLDAAVHQRVLERIGPGNWGPVVPRTETGPSAEFYRGLTHRYWHPDSALVRPRVRIRSGPGDFVIELRPQEAPLTVLNFLTLAERGYFNNGRWHRVVPNFVLQDGDPRGDGSGGPGYTIRDEINRLRYERAAVGMALSGPDTGGSQFFIAHAPQPHLDGGYTIFGFVIEGMDVADRIVLDDPIHSIEVLR